MKKFWHWIKIPHGALKKLREAKKEFEEKHQTSFEDGAFVFVLINEVFSLRRDLADANAEIIRLKQEVKEYFDEKYLVDLNLEKPVDVEKLRRLLNISAG